MRHYAYQARDSVTGDMHYWLSTSPTGGGYPGPNAATELVKLADNGDVDPDSGIVSTSGVVGSSPVANDIPSSSVLNPKRSGIYHLQWSVQISVAVAAATITVTPRVNASAIAGSARIVTIPSGSTATIPLLALSTLTPTGGYSVGVGLSWTGSATITMAYSCMFQEL